MKDDDLWGVDDGNEDETPDAPEPQRARGPVSGPLIVTPAQRVRYYAGTRAARGSVAALLVVSLAAGTWAARAPIVSAWDRLNDDRGTVQPVQSGPSTTGTPVSVDPEKLDDARSELKASITRAEKARANAAEGVDTKDIESALTVARELVSSTSIERIEAGTKLLDSASQKVEDESKPKPGPSPSATSTTSEPSTAPGTPSQPTTQAPQETSAPSTPTERPAQTTPAPQRTTQAPAAPKRASTSLTVTCTNEAVVTFSATGGGSLNLTAGGKSASGSSSASVTVKTNGGSITASASALSSVSLNASWQTAFGSCRM